MESLCDYMLLEVFVRLDPASLKKCTEVCKRWNDLIVQSASTMDKLTLKVNETCDLRNINRRYSNLKLDCITVRPETWSLISDCQQNLRKLELNRIKIKASDYTKMLKSIPTLEELTIINCRMTSSARSIVKMPMLEKFTISECGRFLKNIDGSAVKKLELSDLFRYRKCGNFISTLQQLEDLSLTSLNSIDCRDFAPAQVQLKKLKIIHGNGHEKHIRERRCSLIKAQASTLETLEMKSYFDPERFTDYDLTNVTPSNSLSTQSFDEFYKLLVNRSSFSSLNYSPGLIASTAKYYIPQLKSMKIYRPSST